MFKFVVLLSFAACALAGTIPEGMVRLSDNPAGRIVGGKPTNISLFPWQVSLQRYNSHSCGGTIYNSRIIVTAAHCLQWISASALRIRAGSTYWKTGGVIVYVQAFRNHEGYNKDTHANDIAVIKLSASLSFGSTIRPIDLATTAPANGAVASVSGWGTRTYGTAVLPDQLEYVEVSIIDTKKCASYSYGYGYNVKADMICAAATGKDSCQGDSGGPLVSGGVLVGVVSWARGCALSRYPGVYSNVAVLRNWVLNAVDSI